MLVAYEPGRWESASETLRQDYLAAHRAFEEYVDGHGRRISSAPLAGADTATRIIGLHGRTATPGLIGMGYAA